MIFLTPNNRRHGREGKRERGKERGGRKGKREGWKEGREGERKKEKNNRPSSLLMNRYIYGFIFLEIPNSKQTCPESI